MAKSDKRQLLETLLKTKSEDFEGFV